MGFPMLPIAIGGKGSGYPLQVLAPKAALRGFRSYP